MTDEPKLIAAIQPVEHCGNQLPPLIGDGPVTECVLRPGHQGSHANDEGCRWIEKPLAGYCPHCGRGDAGPTADEYEQQRQRAERAEAEATRLSTILRLLPTSAASLRGQIVEAICTWADHTSADPDAAADAVIAVMARHAALEPPKEARL